jgi:DNA polymerase-3 subunit epsilon
MIRSWLSRWRQSPHPLVTRFNATPIPDTRTSIGDCPLLAIDLETTGLDPRKDHIVSVGWVPVRRREILLTEARHHLIKSPVSVGQSAVIHGLTDSRLQNARSLEAVLTDLLETYAGHVLVAHHAPLDHAFLQTAMQRCFGCTPKLHFIDTLAVESEWLQKKGIAPKAAALSLEACLRRHCLPEGRPHDALEDAYGCALLLLAQTRSTKVSLAGLLRHTRL